MTERMTIKDHYNAIRKFLIENGADASMVAFIDGRIALTDQKNANRSNKPTKSATKTAELAEKVMGLMVVNERYTVTDLLKIVNDPEISNQRMTSALKVLMQTNFVKNEKGKGTNDFSALMLWIL